MTGFDLRRRLAAEALGTAILLATIVGSGIMADRATDDAALTLLANTIPTGAILVVLITLFGPISGAHFNPVVSLVLALQGAIEGREALAYVGAQIVGALLGVAAAHAMFGLPLIGAATMPRDGMPMMMSELVATFGLVAVILGAMRFQPAALPWLVGLFITAAYWFTASTGFANPAVTLARGFTDTFSGIRLWDVPGFIAAEFAGALIALRCMTWLMRERQTAP